MNIELNFEEGHVTIDNENTIDISEIIDVGRIDFCFNNYSLEFVFVEDDYGYTFVYSDNDTYAKLLKVIAENPQKVGAELRHYSNDYSAERELWAQLLNHALEKFNIRNYEYDKLCNAPSGNYYYTKYDQLHRVNSVKQAFDILNSVLPQNVFNTKREYYKRKIESELKTFKAICGNEYENKESYCEYLSKINADDIKKWFESKDELQLLREKIQEYEQDEIIDKVSANNIHLCLNYCIDFVCGRIVCFNREKLLRQYGPVDSLKEILRKSLNRLKFMELLDLYKEYKEQENLLCSKARQSGIKQDEEPFKEYIDVYRLGAVLISNKMNQINKNKAKNKYIPQELLDEALIFYYDAASAKDAESLRRQEEYSQDKESGDRGEQRVEYALKWLDKSYIQIEKRSKDRIGGNCIYLLNSQFIDMKQEYDHLIVSVKGIFNIETKNYSGKLVIDRQGNWIRKKNGEEEGIKNPLQQIRQHEKLLLSFIPEKCKVISIICIANDKAIIEGSENSPVPIIKSDMLVEYIENWDEGEKISDREVKQCVETIYEHMIY